MELTNLRPGAIIQVKDLQECRTLIWYSVDVDWHPEAIRLLRKEYAGLAKRTGTYAVARRFFKLNIPINVAREVLANRGLNG